MTNPKVEISKLSHFRPQVANANAHTQRGLGELSKAFNEVGYVAPMTAAANGEMLDGSARLETAATQFEDEAIIIHHTGGKPIIMIRDDVPDADSPIAKKISYGANRIFELDLSWDPEQFARDIEAGVDFGGLFTEEEQASILSSLKTEPPEDTGPQVDKADELRQKWGVELGQTWTLGEHRLICGDCTDRAVVERVMGGDRASLCVTDPPYGVNYNPQWRVGLGGGGKQDFANGHIIQNDHGLEWIKTFGFLPADVLYCWTADKAAVSIINDLKGFGFNLLYLVIWNKDLAVFGRGDYHHKHEPCLYMIRGNKGHNWQGDRKQETVWDIPTIHSFANGHNKEEWGLVGHGNQKPIECMARPIRNNSAKGELIYDPFLGSGTTMVAAHQLDRRCFGIEIDPGYVAVILERFATTFGIEPELVEL